MNKRAAKSSAAVKMMEVLQKLKEGEQGTMVSFSDRKTTNLYEMKCPHFIEIKIQCIYSKIMTLQ